MVFDFNHYVAGDFYNRYKQVCCGGEAFARNKTVRLRCCGSKQYVSEDALCCPGDALQPRKFGFSSACCDSNVYDTTEHVCCQEKTLVPIPANLKGKDEKKQKITPLFRHYS